MHVTMSSCHHEGLCVALLRGHTCACRLMHPRTCQIDTLNMGAHPHNLSQSVRPRLRVLSCLTCTRRGAPSSASPSRHRAPPPSNCQPMRVWNTPAGGWGPWCHPPRVLQETSGMGGWSPPAALLQTHMRGTQPRGRPRQLRPRMGLHSLQPQGGTWHSCLPLGFHGHGGGRHHHPQGRAWRLR